MFSVQQQSKYIAWFLIFGVFALGRLPSLFAPHWNVDEGFYLAIGQDLLNGNQLYTESWDHKPPMIYWLYAALLWLGQGAYWIIPIVNFGLGLVAIIFVYKLCRLFTEEQASLIGAGLAALALGLTIFEGNVLNGENIFMPLILMGTYLVLTSKKRWGWVLAGGLFGLATLIKAHAVFEISGILLGWVLVSRPDWRLIRRNLILVAVAPVSLWLVVCTYFLTGSDPQLFIFSIILANRGYIGFANNFATLLGVSLPISHFVWRCVVFGVGLGFGLSLMRRWQLKSNLVIVLTWLWFTLFAVMLSGRNFSHYLIQLVPLLSLTLSLSWQYSGLVFKRFELASRLRRWQVAGIYLLTWVIGWQYFFLIFGGGYNINVNNVSPSVYYSFYPQIAQGRYPEWKQSVTKDRFQNINIESLIQTIQAKTGPNDRIWHYSEITALPYYTHRRTGYLVKAWFHIDDYLQPKIETLLQQDPPRLILWDTKYPHNPEFKQKVTRSYTLDQIVDGRFEIWVKI